MREIEYELCVRKFHELSVDDLYNFLKLRVDVFVVEQDCPYPDLDDMDQEATHLFYKLPNGKIIGYLRILNKGVSCSEMAIGRVLVHHDYRKFKLGSKIINDAISYIESIGEISIRLSAQQHLKKFYCRLGFEQVSDMYLEDNIPHIEMLKK